ncbi:jg21897 [Pararge aegeria aegeria]|uniref:Jg21897 protein n=1 Tax=Pararge aegeria aegeria TaxID=348720 RepID=A0A8S4RMT9_9NEOP|nr:jg21897 [Pararge aegeria aegeria]
MAVPDPCRTIFDRISSMFNFSIEQTDNTVVSVYPFGDQIYTMTEVPVLYQIDPESLETIGQKRLPRSLIVFHTAHPHVMSNGDIFETAEVVGSMKPRWRLNPAYMHSFGLTENYFVIIEQPLCVSLVNMVRRYIVPEPFSTTIVSYPEYETNIILIHRETGATTQYTTDTLFFMHIINCFELDGKVLVDLCTYKDGNIIDAMHLDAIKNMQSNPDYGQWARSRPKRITIPIDAPENTKVEATLLADVGVEMPRINYEMYNGNHNINLHKS